MGLGAKRTMVKRPTGYQGHLHHTQGSGFNLYYLEVTDSLI